MGNTLVSKKSIGSRDINNNSLDGDIYYMNWLEAIEKSFIFVWCDASIGTDNNVNDHTNTKTHIANIVNKNRQVVHTFSELEACRDFITHVSNVCLIISGSMGEELVPDIHNLEQIHSIYIFCVNKPKHDIWASNYRKIRGVFTDIRRICESLQTNILSRSILDYDPIEFDLISNQNNSPIPDQHEICLIHSELLKTILLNMDSFDHGTQDMMNYCRNEYTLEFQIKLVREFEQKYAEHDAIWWYTRNCFFQGIINRALRSHDLYALCSMHRFIQDIHFKLLQLYNNSRTSDETQNFCFGQLLSEEDFQRIIQNRGGLMSIDQFILADSRDGMALIFLQRQALSGSNANRKPVLFQIHVDRTKEAIVPYAQIGSVSDFVPLDEYLISMGSVYRINQIEQMSNTSSIWVVKLTLLSKDDLQYNNLPQCLQIEQLVERNLPELGHTIKNRLYPFKLANKLFKLPLQSNNEKFRMITLHYNMAIVYETLSEYQKSLNEYNFVLNIARNSIPTCRQNDDLCLVPIYSNMAITYDKTNQSLKAIPYAFRALEILSTVRINPLLKKELESSCYLSLGSIHDRKGEIDQARISYEKALQIRQEYLLFGHPDITALQRLITLLSSNETQSEYL